MSDRWWGYITIEDVPATWLTTTRTVRVSYGSADVVGEQTPEEEVVSEQHEIDLTNEAIPEKVREAIAYLGLERGDVQYDHEARTLQLSDDQLSGGSWRFLEDGLADALREAGVPFNGGDDGDYGNPGIQFWWRPGLEAIETRTATAEGSIALEIHDLRRMWTAAEDESGYSEPAVFKEKLRAALCEHFDVEDLRLEEEATADA